MLGLVICRCALLHLSGVLHFALGLTETLLNAYGSMLFWSPHFRSIPFTVGGLHEGARLSFATAYLALRVTLKC